MFLPHPGTLCTGVGGVKPRYVICVLLEHGEHGYASAVVAKKIFEMMMQQGLI